MRSFQEIYDFCHLDNTWQCYFKIPSQLEIRNRRIFKYWYGELHNGQCRAGTFLFCQSLRQLERYIGKKATKNWHIHIQADNFEPIEDIQNFDGHSLYIVTRIGSDGVIIQCSHPFAQTTFEFTARSHRIFDSKGVIAETKAYIEKHFLFAPGRFRDLQIEHHVPKESFVAWYKQYRQEKRQEAESEHRNMLARYNPVSYMNYDDARDILAMSGMFYDFCSDEYERDEMTEQFLCLCNQ